jgi:hypothetical protein
VIESISKAWVGISVSQVFGDDGKDVKQEACTKFGLNEYRRLGKKYVRDAAGMGNFFHKNYVILQDLRRDLRASTCISN